MPNCSKGRRLDGERVQADVYEIRGPGGEASTGRDTPGARKVREKATKWYGQYTDVDDKLTKTPLEPIRSRRVRCSRICARGRTRQGGFDRSSR